MNNKIISLLLVEDHEIVRKGIKTLLEMEKKILVISEACNGIEGVQLAKTLAPDIILMDITMPQLNGLEATKEILKENKNAKILILSAYADDGYIERAFKLGASGYIIKQCSPEILIEAIYQIYQGKLYFLPSIQLRHDQLNLIDFNNEGKERTTTHNRLSQREIQVLQLIAEGNANKIIADILSISIKTVDKHRQNLMKKLAIHDTAGLTRYAMNEGIIESSPH